MLIKKSYSKAILEISGVDFGFPCGCGVIAVSLPGQNQRGLLVCGHDPRSRFLSGDW